MRLFQATVSCALSASQPASPIYLTLMVNSEIYEQPPEVVTNVHSVSNSMFTPFYLHIRNL